MTVMLRLILRLPNLLWKMLRWLRRQRLKNHHLGMHR